MILQTFLNDTISFGAVKIPLKETIEGYRTRYNALISKARITYTPYYVMPGGRILIHFKIPSETVPNFFYDVLLELSGGQKSKSFSECDVKFFSNCPSFVYTYAYTFYNFRDPSTKTKLFVDEFGQKIPKNNLIVRPSEKKYDEIVLTSRPNTRNPYELPLLDKSLYYAIFFMIDNLDYNRIIGNRHLSTIAAIMRNITSFDKLMMQRKKAVAEGRESKRKKTIHATAFHRSHEKRLNRENDAGVKKVHQTAKMKPITSKQSGAIKKVNKIGRKK